MSEIKYKIFEKDGQDDPSDDCYKYKIKVLCMHRVKDSDIWLLQKQGAIFPNKEMLDNFIEKHLNDKMIKKDFVYYNIFGYNLTDNYEIDEFDKPVGEWPLLSRISFEICETVTIDENELSLYDSKDCNFFYSYTKKAQA